MLIGLVGKPSSGKSTFFQALTSVAVERSERPFTTIKPNRGMGYVEVECVDKEFNVQCNPRSGYCVNGRRFAPVEMLDVAGLVPGAHEGKGLGNKFLDDLRQADILIHIVDASGSTNENGEAVEQGSHDPVKDVKFLEEELDYWFKGILDNNWQKLVREANLNKKNEEVMFQQFTGLGISRGAVQKTLKNLNLAEKTLTNWSAEERFNFCKQLRENGKQIIIAANKCDLAKGWENYERIKAAYPQKLVFPCSAEAELTLKGAAKHGFISYIPGDADFKELKPLAPEQKKALEFIRTVLQKVGSTGVQKIINSAVFDCLHYIAIFPGGVNKLSDSFGRILPDVFLLPPNSTAFDFANALHSDIGTGFIKAIDVKTKRAYGKEHILEHRAVVEIQFKKP